MGLIGNEPGVKRSETQWKTDVYEKKKKKIAKRVSAISVRAHFTHHGIIETAYLNL